MKRWIIKSLSIIAGIGGVALIGFSADWYLHLHKDLSQFIAFFMLGIVGIVTGIVFEYIYELSYEVGKVKKDLDYIEDKLIKEPEIEEESEKIYVGSWDKPKYDKEKMDAIVGKKPVQKLPRSNLKSYEYLKKIKEII